MHPRFDRFSFGSIQIDGSSYEHDVVIDRGKIRRRKKKPSLNLPGGKYVALLYLPKAGATMQPCN